MAWTGSATARIPRPDGSLEVEQRWFPYATAFMAEYRARGMGGPSLDQYLFALRHLAQSAAEQDPVWFLTFPTVGQVTQWRDRHGQFQTAATRTFRLSVLKQYCQWLQTQRVVPRERRAVARQVVAQCCRRLTCAPPVPVVPLVAEVETFLADIPAAFCRTGLNKVARARAFWEVLVATGCRMQEVGQLRWEQYQRPEPPSEVGHLVVRGKGNRPRPVFLRPRAVAALEHWYGTKPFAPTAAMFPAVETSDTVGVAPASYGYNLAEFHHIWNDAGLTKAVTPHKFRHAFAVQMVEAGGDVESTRRLLGHQHLTTTQRYLQGMSLAAIENTYLRAMSPEIPRLPSGGGGTL